MRVKRMMVPLLAVLALLPAGCGGSAGAAAPATGVPATASASPGKSAPRTGPVVPAVIPDSLKFTGTTLDGKPFDATKFAGRPVVIWFWAPWCAVCLGQASTVGDLAKRYDGKVAMYGGRARISRSEIYRRAVAMDLPAEVVTVLEALPEGEYAQEEAGEALAQLGGSPAEATGVPASVLSTADLSRELRHLHETRDDALRHASARALANHDERTAELEAEYLVRFPDREVDPRRLRPAQSPA
jgi:thiol-disulfide isomerase/thioredoxin